MNHETDSHNWHHGRRGGWRGYGPDVGPGDSDQFDADGSRQGHAGPPFPGAPFFGGPFAEAWFSGGGRGRGGRPRRGGRVRRGNVRLAILALLAEQPMNGYQIIQALTERTHGLWTPSPGAVYPALNQLEDERLVEAVDVAGQKAFRLTDAGSAAAAEVDPKPWDVVIDESGVNTEGAASLWQELAGLAVAAKAVMASGSPQQIRAAAKVIAVARKRLYGLLAEDAAEPEAE